MKSKIEKLNIFVDELSGKNCVKVLGIVKKVDEIIDRLNEQPEEKIEYFDKGDKVRTYKSLEVSEKAYSEEPTVEDVYIEDTPEEWEKELRKRWYLWTYNKELDQYITCENEVIDFIQAELGRAREEGYEEGMRAVLYPKLKRDKNGTIKREGWVDTSKLKEKK